MKTTIFIILVVVSLAIINVSSFATQWEVIYQTDFSTDPGWTTNDPTNIFWDSATQTLHAWQSNTNTSYAYVPTSLLTNQSFKLQFDSCISSCELWAGLTFGLWDNRTIFPHGLWIDQGNVIPQGYITSLGYELDPWQRTNISNWQYNTWYRTTVIYDAATNSATLDVIHRDTGTPFTHIESTQLPLLPSDMILMGVTRLHMEGYTGNAVDYNLDNIILSQQVPEPGVIPVFNPANGHYYEFVPAVINWNSAKIAASELSYQGLQGHLATITSVEENQFVLDIIRGKGTGAVWLGGYQPPGSTEPAGGWTWITGETWEYTNWNIEEPSNHGPFGYNEDSLMMYGPHEAQPTVEGKWNDEYSDEPNGYPATFGYVVEYDSLTPIPPPPTIIPEPGTMAMMAPALLGFAGIAFRRMRK